MSLSFQPRADHLTNGKCTGFSRGLLLTWIRRAIKVLDAFSGGLGLVSEIAGAMAEGFLGTADIVMDERLAPLSATPRVKVAAMFHDARAV
jgi:hypothetical protein